jgi:hypothetical protein
VRGARSVSEPCPGLCGVRVAGEIDPDSREFVHRFELPANLQILVQEARTEVEEIRLVTFAPGSGEWSVGCPVCGRPIPLGEGAGPGT